MRKNVTRKAFRRRYRDVFKGDAEWRKIKVKPAASPIKWDANSTYVQNPPYFAGMTMTPDAGDRHRRCPHARIVPRFDHHRPHLARRFDQGRLARPAVILSARCRPHRLQLLWIAARQSRGDDARHLRQYPHQEPDGAGRRRAASPSTIPRGEQMPIYDAAMQYQAPTTFRW